MKAYAVTIQVSNNRKRTRGRKFHIVKMKDGKTIKLQNITVYHNE